MKKQIIRLTEGDLHKIIKESVLNILKEDFNKQNEINASWDAFEKTRQPKSKYSIDGNLDTYIDDEDSWYEYGRDKYDDVMNYDEDYMFDDYHQFSKFDDGFNGIQAQSDKPFHKEFYQKRGINQQRKLEDYV